MTEKYAPDNIEKVQLELNKRLLEEGVLIDGKNLLPVSLSPYLIEQKKYKRLSYLCEKIINALEKFLRIYVENVDIQEMYPELTNYRLLTLKKPPYDNWIHLARFDIAETIDGSFKLLETNCDCPGAILFAPVINRILSEINAYPQLQINSQPEIVNETLFINSLVNVFQKINGDSIPNIAFLTSSFRNISSDMNLLEKIGNRMGLVCKHINIQDLREIGGNLQFDGFSANVGYQKFDAFIDVNNQAKPCIFENSPDEVADYWKCMMENKILIFNSFPSALVAENKRTLAYLQDPVIKKYFSDEENMAINEMLPKTFSFYKNNSKLDIDKMKVFIINKDKYVIKRVIDTRGRGVWIGKECNPLEWEELVLMTINKPYIIQEYIPNRFDKIYSPSSIPIPTGMYTNLAMFIVAGKPSGLISRASSEIVTNVGKSGCIRPVYIV